ncbi:OmpA family protein [Granulosicoccus sp. 3-233]|uniref:OmpA family protein n=1 Tax=Granulosicoccus sp. 3-233 TaxID=3417969 RepID=UPI003D3467B9
MKRSFLPMLLLSVLPGMHGCATTEELYAQYDKQSCRVALEQVPSGELVVHEIARKESRNEALIWEPVVRFDIEQDVLSTASRDRLDRDVFVLHRYPELRVSVRGFTDASGARAFNARLAARRVQVVVDYLRSQGIDSGRMDKVPLGEGLPLKLAGPEARVPENRRVELMLLDVNGNPLALTVTAPDED